MRYYLNQANIILQQIQMLMELKTKYEEETYGWIHNEIENKLIELHEIKTIIDQKHKEENHFINDTM